MKDTEFFERVLGLRELCSVKDIEMDVGAVAEGYRGCIVLSLERDRFGELN
jgi:hypothetical protein